MPPKLEEFSTMTSCPPCSDRVSVIVLNQEGSKLPPTNATRAAEAESCCFLLEAEAQSSKNHSFHFYRLAFTQITLVYYMQA